MTTASPPASSARILFFSPLRRSQPRQPVGRISTWPFRVATEKDRDGGNLPCDGNDVRLHAARVLRTTAEHWWPPAG
ncbi:hypothetical protein EH244_09600 [Variovorax beijingensis]|uniref:Uncharacterized protein n=1 Tax=Variovorax beijingensis TaxID=2496117 RepID=A0A3P3EUE6_9BURK|nr:hypothetical protein [Variovorax beijingensis]RRH89827.1 hypothetical protein EH244_09600 [Variovorax beijingensis]RSZ41509.1 hypothetical protein EJO66_06200 [Variovorax beijingensis]